MKKYKILCVCLGNICRSPTAEAILRDTAKKAGLLLEVDSAGTANYHIGEAPDLRSQQYAKQAGYDLSKLRARQISVDDFMYFDYILAMDSQNLIQLQKLQQQAQQKFTSQPLTATLAMMTQHSTLYHNQPVPDPYYGEEQDFKKVIQLCEDSSQAWIDFLQHD